MGSGGQNSGQNWNANQSWNSGSNGSNLYQQVGQGNPQQPSDYQASTYSNYPNYSYLNPFQSFTGMAQQQNMFQSPFPQPNYSIQPEQYSQTSAPSPAVVSSPTISTSQTTSSAVPQNFDQAQNNITAGLPAAGQNIAQPSISSAKPTTPSPVNSSQAPSQALINSMPFGLRQGATVNGIHIMQNGKVVGNVGSNGLFVL